jgi:NADH dehydrogenase (ubiquinone) 1 alpha subcomplex subunit 9
VPYRDEDEKRHLRVMGDLGQIVPMVCRSLLEVFGIGADQKEWDARNPDQIYECLKHSDAVYNLTGRDWETR